MLHEMGLINDTRFTVFGKEPRRELTSRGVPGVKTMHSMGLAALTDFNNAAVQEEREMKETGRAKKARKVITTVSHVKQNLLVTMALEIEFGKDFGGLHIFVKVFPQRPAPALAQLSMLDLQVQPPQALVGVRDHLVHLCRAESDSQ